MIAQLELFLQSRSCRKIFKAVHCCPSQIHSRITTDTCSSCLHKQHFIWLPDTFLPNFELVVRLFDKRFYSWHFIPFQLTIIFLCSKYYKFHLRLTIIVKNPLRNLPFLSYSLGYSEATAFSFSCTVQTVSPYFTRKSTFPKTNLKGD